DSVLRAAQGAEAIVNLVGILAPSGRQSFDAVHSFGARAIATAAAEVGAGLVHVSAIGADAKAKAHYARTKGEGEQLVREIVPGSVILRPSLVFGPEDEFFNRFAGMSRLSPFLPLIGGGETRFQPVFVGDVAAAVERAVDGKAAAGTTYELGGPEVQTFKELMELMLREIGSERVLLPLPFGAADLMARVLEKLPMSLLTRDQVAMLHFDNVVSAEASAEQRTLQGLGIAPASMSSVLPSYLWRFRKAGQFTRVET
ncbi:MAG: complex I NDUFA9 subunit family protein, partial [Rhizobiales bacterium 32-66-8]